MSVNEVHLRWRA